MTQIDYEIRDAIIKFAYDLVTINNEKYLGLEKLEQISEVERRIKDAKSELEKRLPDFDIKVETVEFIENNTLIYTLYLQSKNLKETPNYRVLLKFYQDFGGYIPGGYLIINEIHQKMSPITYSLFIKIFKKSRTFIPMPNLDSSRWSSLFFVKLYANLQNAEIKHEKDGVSLKNEILKTIKELEAESIDRFKLDYQVVLHFLKELAEELNFPPDKA